MPSIYDEHALTPLVDSDGPYSGTNKNSLPKGILFNRIMTILSLVLLVVASLYFQASQSQLSNQLSSDEEKIHLLTQTLEAQSHVIQRFNESVTNSDVLKQLEALEDGLHQTTHDLKKELNKTKFDVSSKLDQTLTELDATVQKAEEEITQEVETVKKDFEQYVVRTEDQFSMENSFMVYQLAGTFTLLSCLISMWHMTAHLRKMNQPVIQRKILAILWMSPVYAITSWFSLVFHEAEGYLAIVKDGYEAYIIYQFLSFCISVLGKGNRQAVVELLAKRADHLTPPFRLCFCCRGDHYENNRALADAILLQCQFFAMQFVFFRPITTIAKVVLAKYDYFGPWGAESANDYRAPQFYVTLIQNLSIFVAFTGLLKFYHAVDKDLEWCRPFAKFLCIKGVVFMTFWQGLAITILAETTDVGGGDAEEWAMSAQNFLICLEMLLFSIAHFYCFPTDEWEENYKANYNKAKFGDSIALGDFFQDLKLIMAGNKSTRKKKKKPSEPTVPEGDEEASEGETEVQYESEDEIPQGDSTSVTSDVTSNTADPEDPRLLLEKTIEKTIKSDTETEDAAVAEARQRIMESGFLDEMIFLSPAATKDVSLTEAGNLATEYGTSVEEQTKGATGKTALKTPAKYFGDGLEEASADERTGLLANSTADPSPLRPSIFTTIADLSENNLAEDKES